MHFIEDTGILFLNGNNRIDSALKPNTFSN